MKKGAYGLNYIFIKPTPEKWIRIDFDTIFYVESKGNDVIFYLENGTSILYKNMRLGFLKTLLPVFFERIQRRYIVNIKLVKSINNTCSVLSMVNGVHLSIGKNYRDSVKKYI